MALVNTSNFVRTCRSSLGVPFFRLRSVQPKLTFQDAQARDISTKAVGLCIRMSSRNCLAKSLSKAKCWVTYFPEGGLHSLVWYVTNLHFSCSIFLLAASDGEGSVFGLSMESASSYRDGSPSLLQMGRARYSGFRWGGLPIWALDGESFLSGLQMCGGSLSLLQMGRALYLGFGWGVFPIRASDH
jgi:hypothetical protein